MTKRYDDPVNYELTEKDISGARYSRFLDDLTDVPSSRALKPFSIDKAGISEQQAYVTVRSLFDKKKTATILANLKMQVSLMDHRGIHMSRCEEALFSLIGDVHDSLDDFAVKLASEILKLQKAGAAYVDITGTYIHTRETVKSKKLSHDRMTMLAQAACHKDGKTSSTIGLTAFNMTGCPCTETFTKFSVVPQLKKAGYDLSQIKEILGITKSGTHTQRGLATLKVDNPGLDISYEDLYVILDGSCHLVYELLKRPDEHELVVRVLDNPQFTEDVVREIAHNVVKKIGRKLTDDAHVFISSQLYDSIHIHDVYTEIDKTYGELVDEKRNASASG